MNKVNYAMMMLLAASCFVACEKDDNNMKSVKFQAVLLRVINKRNNSRVV
jgi:hypothetical protein